MPQVQVIQRDDPNAYNNFSDNLQRQQTVLLEANNRKQMLKYYADKMALDAKLATDENQTQRYKARSEKAKYLSSVFENILKNNEGNADGAQKALLAHFAAFQDDWLEIMSDDSFLNMVKQLDGMKQNPKTEAETRLSNAKADYFSGTGQGGQGGQDGDWVMSARGPEGPTYTNLAAARQKALVDEGTKPFGSAEATTAALPKALEDVWEQVFTDLEGRNKRAEGLGFFGGMRIGAAGEKGPAQRMLRFTAGAASERNRKLISALSKIKLLAFGEGGKNLTENERQLVTASMNPEGKSVEQWIEDLRWVKSFAEEKARALTTPRDEYSSGARAQAVQSTMTPKAPTKIGRFAVTEE